MKKTSRFHHVSSVGPPVIADRNARALAQDEIGVSAQKKVRSSDWG